MGEVVQTHLQARGIAADKALKIAKDIAQSFGALEDSKAGKETYIKQLAFISPQEQAAALEAADRMVEGAPAPKPADLLRRTDAAADIAMFGRMLAATPDFNREAAVQVAHAITTHKAVVEDDYYVAVDDLNAGTEDLGAGFIGEQGFGSGIFYLYLCVDVALLRQNLGGDDALAAASLAALAKAAACVAPTGKQNSFASRAKAHFILAERGDQQPHTLAGAFLKAAPPSDPLAASIESLTTWRNNLNKAYELTPEAEVQMNPVAGHGTISDIVQFCQQAVG